MEKSERIKSKKFELLLDETTEEFLEEAKKYAREFGYRYITPEVIMASFLSYSKRIQLIIGNDKPDNYQEFRFKLETYLTHKEIKKKVQNPTYSDDTLILLVTAHKRAVMIDEIKKQWCIEHGRSPKKRPIVIYLYDLMAAFYKCDFYVSELLRSTIPDENTYEDLLTLNVDGI